MATFAEKFEQKYKQPKTSKTGSSFAEKFESKGAGSRILEEYKITLQHREEEKQRKLQEEQARLEAEKNKPSLLQKAGTFGKGLLQEIGKGLVRPAISLAELPLNIASGGARTFGDMNVPLLGKVQSYQEATRQAQEEVISGKKPLYSVLAPAAEGILDVAGLGITGGIAKAGIKSGVKTALKQGAKEGAIYGAGYGGVQALEEPKGIKETAKSVAISAAGGAAFGGAIGAIAGKLGSKFTKVQKAIDEGTTTEKEIVDIFEQKGLKGVEEVIAEPTVLKPGELAPIVKEIESQTGVKLKPSEALQVKADLEKGISKEAIINDIVEPPTRTTMPVEPPKVTKPTTTPKESPLIQEARKYKGVEMDYVRNTEKSPKRSDFAQNIEPSGKYMNLGDPKYAQGMPNMETGKIKFDNPLVVEWKTSREGGWKTDLSNKYGGKKGKALSDAIRKDGYDGIITVDNGNTAEVVSLKQSQPLQEGVEKVSKTELPKIETTPSKVAKSIEAKAVEEKLTKGFGDIAGYEKITIKEQAQKTSKLLDEEFDNAVKMVKGEMPVKEGIKPEMLIKTMEDYAQAKGDVNLLRDIAKSPLVSETSAHAQALRILAERNPESALTNIQKVIKERSTSFERKSGKTIDKATKEVADEIKSKVKQKIPTKQDWDNFINEIKC